jgi:hypothetical protein
VKVIMRALYNVYCARMARRGFRPRANGAARGKTASVALAV